MTNLYGLIGKTLTHSFSQRFFREKFQKEAIINSDYLLFELDKISEFPSLLKEQTHLKGLNVTIPYKQEVIPYLSQLDTKAKEIGAVNTIKVMDDNALMGFNTDYFGFKSSIEKWIPAPYTNFSALILGTGGASKAVYAALKDLNISVAFVSRNSSGATLSYEDLKSQSGLMNKFKLIINTTPLGTSPKTDEAPDIPYEGISEDYFLYDLVYNPSETLFMKKGKASGAQVKNGLEMLQLQAEKAWEIWNS